MSTPITRTSNGMHQQSNHLPFTYQKQRMLNAGRAMMQIVDWVAHSLAVLRATILDTRKSMGYWVQSEEHFLEISLKTK